MDIDALRSFVAFIETGSFTQAAARVFRTQSAVSMQMKKLESDIGQALFQKQGRNVALTDQGRMLASYARRILVMHDEAMGQLASGAVVSPLRIGCPDDYVESILTSLLALIRQRLPDMGFQVHCDHSGELRRLLSAGSIDAAILTSAPDQEEGYLLHQDVGVWMHGGFPELLDAMRVPLILYEATCKFHSAAIDGMDKLGRPYDLVCATQSATTIKSLLKQGMGITAMARSSRSEGIFEFDLHKHQQLPVLPSVDIVLQLGTHTHSLFGHKTAAEVSRAFHQQMQLGGWSRESNQVQQNYQQREFV
ncbi:LysR family transcriptional regulator [Oceanobacter mangrovi]|uniref:LysR family transcriptional regulator n=1 Tax=Oceanobacter mangrovi TaxID=2862510 RepID=UPI001C8EFEB8|nr:LysR family transcriptional regulator [Oceanobacter mangrovi]